VKTRGKSTRAETIRNARIQINTRVSLRRSFWRVVIDRSAHKFRANDNMLPGRTVLMRIYGPHLAESQLSDRDRYRDDRLGLTSRLDRYLADLIYVLMRQRPHQVGHQRKAGAPRRQYPKQNHRTHVRPHVMIDSRSLSRFARLPREFHCAMQKLIGYGQSNPNSFYKGRIKIAGPTGSHACDPSPHNRISHDNIGREAEPLPEKSL
jgi:hypothetical protein